MRSTFTILSSILLISFLTFANSAAARGEAADSELPAQLSNYYGLFSEVSNRIHEEELNGKIRKFHGAYRKFQQKHSKGLVNRSATDAQRENSLKIANDLMILADETLGHLKTVVAYQCIDVAKDSIALTAGQKRPLVQLRPDYILMIVYNSLDAPSKLRVEGLAGNKIEIKPRTINLNPGRISFALLETNAAKAGKFEISLRFTCDEAELRKTGKLTVAESAMLNGVLYNADSGKMAPARVYVTASDGRQYIPMDHDPEKPSHYDFAYGFFYAEGEFQIRVPVGEAKIRAERGFEFNALKVETNVSSQAGDPVAMPLTRWIDMVENGWYSTDSHLHYVKQTWYQEGDWDELDMRKRAEDINVANVLPLMHWWKPHNNLVAIRPNKYEPTQGLLEKYSKGRYVTTVGEEMRNNDFYCHLVFWNNKGIVAPVSTGWMGGPDAPDYPCNTQMADKCRAAGGYVATAHDISKETPVMAILGRLDLVDIHSPDKWYDLLNCGFRLPCEIGSDYPANKMGFERAYVYTGSSEFDWDDFLEALIKGRTFVSSGAMVFFEADGMIPGDEIKVAADKPQKIKVKLKAQWKNPLQRLELVHNGKVILQIKPDRSAKTLEYEGEVEIPGKGWIAARCSANQYDNWWPVPGIAHTSPIYLDDGTGPYLDADSANNMLAISEKTLEKAMKSAKFDTEQQRAEVKAIFEEGIGKYKDLIKKAGGQVADAGTESPRGR